MAKVDLNCDMGEGMGDDAAMLTIVTRANVACGFHAGDANHMHSTMRLAKQHGVAVGAHPSFDDREGFGRRRMAVPIDELERLVAYQVGAAAGIAAHVGTALSHVKPHGALSNMAEENAELACAIVRAVKGVDAGLAVMAMSGLALERAAREGGLTVIREAFIDRAYQPNGQLVPRNQDGAVIHDADKAAARALQMIEQQAVFTTDGTPIPTPIESLCVHGDTAGAVAIAKQVRDLLVAKGHDIQAFEGT